MTDKSVAQIHARIVSRTWADPAFKARLMSDPHGALAEEGLKVPAGTTVKVHENTASTHHIVIPAKPGAGVTNVGGGTSPQDAVMCVICTSADAVMCVICTHPS